MYVLVQHNNDDISLQTTTLEDEYVMNLEYNPSELGYVPRYQLYDSFTNRVIPYDDETQRHIGVFGV